MADAGQPYPGAAREVRDETGFYPAEPFAAGAFGETSLKPFSFKK
jgi:hypothetical protein